MMVAQPETGADLVSAVWIFIMFGTMAGSGLVAIFAEKDPSLFFWVSLPFAAQIIVPIAAGWLPEEPAVAGVRTAKWQANKKYFGLAVLMSVGALCLGVASLWGSAVVQAAYSITVSVVLCAASLWLLPPLIGTSVGAWERTTACGVGRGRPESSRRSPCIDERDAGPSTRLGSRRPHA